MQRSEARYHLDEIRISITGPDLSLLFILKDARIGGLNAVSHKNAEHVRR